MGHLVSLRDGEIFVFSFFFFLFGRNGEIFVGGH